MNYYCSNLIISIILMLKSLLCAGVKNYCNNLKIGSVE
jgi:hypothetical protein